MEMFFEHSIPEKAPSYMEFHVRPKYELAARRVINRMNLLETALILSGLRGEVFSAAVHHLFTSLDANGDPLMDKMDAEALADAALLTAAGYEHLPDRMVWPNCDVLVDTAFVQTKEWETLRMLGIGGSDSANIKNEGYSSARAVYYDKVGWPGDEENHAPDKGLQYIFDYGHRMEPMVIDEFCRRTGAVRVPESRMFRHRNYPFLTANIDQIVRMPDGRYFVFEAKTTTIHNRDKWADGAVPRAYVPQCHKYPLVLNDDRICGTYIGCIYGNTPNDFACSFLPRDEDYEDEQLDLEVAFWNDFVLAGEEPPLSGDGEKDMEILKKIRSKPDSAAPKAQLGEDCAELINSYLSLKKQASEFSDRADNLKKGMDALRAQIVAALGNNPLGSCVVPEEFAPDEENEYVYEVSNKPRKGTTVDKEMLRLAYPEAYAACVKETPDASFTFNVKVRRAI